VSGMVDPRPCDLGVQNVDFLTAIGGKKKSDDLKFKIY